MMAWLIMRTEPAKEQKAAAGMNGFETYLPMEFREYREGPNRERKIKEIPIIPRMIFIRHPDPRGLYDIIGHKYCTGLVKHPTVAPPDLYRRPYVIPDRLMARFQEIVSWWRLEALDLHAKQAVKKSKQPKKMKAVGKDLKNLKAYMDGLAKEAA
jgi:hypothetical protein